MTNSEWREVWAYTEEPAEPGGWIKPAGYTSPSEMPPEFICPRPDDERGADSRISYNHSVMAYEVPIIVLGGAPPYHFEVTSNMTGVTVEDWSPDWNPGCICGGVVKVPANKAGSYTIMAYDQEHTDSPWGSVTVSITVNDGKFAFVDFDNGNNSNTGTIEHPIKDAAAWYGSMYQDAFAGKLLVFRGGVHSTVADTENNDQLASADHKPRAMFGYPGEDAILDFSNSPGGFTDSFTLSGGAYPNHQHDLYRANMTWRNAGAFTSHNGSGNNQVWWGLRFYNFAGDLYPAMRQSNTGCIIYLTAGNQSVPHRDYTGVLDCTAELCTPRTNGWDMANTGNLVETYDMQRVTVAGCKIIGPYAGQTCWFIKGQALRAFMVATDGWTDTGCFRGPYYPYSTLINFEEHRDKGQYTIEPAITSRDQVRIISMYCRGFNPSDADWHFTPGSGDSAGASKAGGRNGTIRMTIFNSVKDTTGEPDCFLRKCVIGTDKISKVMGYTTPQIQDCLGYTRDGFVQATDTEGRLLDPDQRYKYGHEVLP